MREFNAFTAYLWLQGSRHEAQTLSDAAPSFFRRNYDYDETDYQQRVKRVRKKRKKKAQYTQSASQVNDQSGLRRDEYDLEAPASGVIEFVEKMNGPRYKKKKHRPKKKPTTVDLSDNFTDHCIDQCDQERMMHDRQNEDNARSNQYSSDVAI